MPKEVFIETRGRSYRFTACELAVLNQGARSKIMKGETRCQLEIEQVREVSANVG